MSLFSDAQPGVRWDPGRLVMRMSPTCICPGGGLSSRPTTAPLRLPGVGVRPERWLVLLILSNRFFLVFVFIFTFLDDSRHLLDVFGCDH